MKSHVALMAMLLLMPLEGAGDPSVETSASRLAWIVIPRVEWKDETMEDAVEFLNLVLHAPDPSPPKEWKIRVQDNSGLIGKKLSFIGKELPLHKLLGIIADQAGADLLVGKNGYTLVERTK